MTTLSEAMASLNKQKSLVGGVNDVPRTHGAVSTGLIGIDRWCRGGFPRGRISQCYGANNSGKSTLVMGAAAELHRRVEEGKAERGTVLYVDTERTFDPVYAQTIGVDVENASRFLYCAPDDGMDAIQVMEQLIRTSEIDLVILDSITFMVPRAMLEADADKSLPAIQARQNSMMVRRLTAPLANTNTPLVVVNHLSGTMRSSQQTGMEITEVGGGKMLQNGSSFKILAKKKEWPSGPDGKPAKPADLNSSTHSETTFKIEKNKVGRQYIEVDARLEFGYGFDRVFDLVNCIGDLTQMTPEEDRKDLPVRQASAYFYVGDAKWQGKEKFIASLLEDADLMALVDTAVRGGFGL